jgi:hypothetical protein
MNTGERDELLAQIKLIDLRDCNGFIPGLGDIRTVGFKNEYRSLPIGFNLSSLKRYSDQDLNAFALSLGISKASGRMKADTIVNRVPVSIKSNNAAAPALVNHTTRPGFEFAGQHAGGIITELDRLVDEYWSLRNARAIGEDIKNSDPRSPFAANKAIVQPFLNHFLFLGTGASLSELPAEKILGLTDPLDVNTWSVYDKSNAIDIYWDKLIFSLRAKKGMPSGYPDNLSPKMQLVRPSVDRWTRHIDNGYRGALHIRSSS